MIILLTVRLEGTPTTEKNYGSEPTEWVIPVLLDVDTRAHKKGDASVTMRAPQLMRLGQENGLKATGITVVEDYP